jgi:hypothetical protein
LADSPRIRALMQQIERQVHLDRTLFLPATVPSEESPAKAAKA